MKECGGGKEKKRKYEEQEERELMGKRDEMGVEGRKNRTQIPVKYRQTSLIIKKIYSRPRHVLFFFSLFYFLSLTPSQTTAVTKFDSGRHDERDKLTPKKIIVTLFLGHFLRVQLSVQ